MPVFAPKNEVAARASLAAAGSVVSPRAALTSGVVRHGVKKIKRAGRRNNGVRIADGTACGKAANHSAGVIKKVKKVTAKSAELLRLGYECWCAGDINGAEVRVLP